jgi:hypothetical protein
LIVKEDTRESAGEIVDEVMETEKSPTTYS